VIRKLGHYVHVAQGDDSDSPSSPVSELTVESADLPAESSVQETTNMQLATPSVRLHDKCEVSQSSVETLFR